MLEIALDHTASALSLKRHHMLDRTTDSDIGVECQLEPMVAAPVRATRVASGLDSQQLICSTKTGISGVFGSSTLDPKSRPTIAEINPDHCSGLS